MNQTHGVIQSPGYPHHYPGRRDCYWQFAAEYGKRLQFIFTHLDIEHTVNCTFDFIEFREGIKLVNQYSTDSTVIAKFCNWTASPETPVPAPITSSGSFAMIHFHSDPAISSQGFQLVFNQIPGVCGGLLTGSTGLFNTPSTAYTGLTGRTRLAYQNNIVCDWLIRVLPDERISLTFISFNLESYGLFKRKSNITDMCLFDYLEVYDGENYNAPLRARLCGSIRPPEIISTGRFLRVKFQSDASVSRSGFIAKYVSC